MSEENKKLPVAGTQIKKPSVGLTKVDSFRDLLKRAEREIAAALPKHIAADRMMRIALTEARKNPKLLDCDQLSFLGALMQASQLGLEPGSGLGQCYLIPYFNKRKGISEVQFQPGYKGLIDLAYRSEKVGHVIAREVRQGDHFIYQYGTNEYIEHQVLPKEESRGEITHAYAIVFLKNGSKPFVVLSREEIEEFRKFSQDPTGNVWKNHYGAMAKKTALKQLFKFTPVSIEIQKAVALDEASNAGLLQGNVHHVPEGLLPKPRTKVEELQDKLEGREPATLSPDEILPFEEESTEREPGGEG